MVSHIKSKQLYQLIPMVYTIDQPIFCYSTTFSMIRKAKYRCVALASDVQWMDCQATHVPVCISEIPSRQPSLHVYPNKLACMSFQLAQPACLPNQHSLHVFPIGTTWVSFHVARPAFVSNQPGLHVYPMGLTHTSCQLAQPPALLSNQPSCLHVF